MKTLILASVLLFTTFPAMAQSAITKPEESYIFKNPIKPGFRDLKWEDGIPKGMKPAWHDEKLYIKVYTKPNDNMMIGGASLSTIYYMFFSDRFAAAIITTKPQEGKNLLAVLEEMWGFSPRLSRYIDNYHWQEGNTSASFEINLVDGSAKVTIACRSISDEIGQVKRKVAAEGKKDM